MIVASGTNSSDYETIAHPLVWGIHIDEQCFVHLPPEQNR
jgi:hypothetical protein